MKKFFEILGIIFSFLIIIGIVVVAYISIRGNGLDRESQQFVDTAVPQIVANWDAKKFIEYTDQESLTKAGISEEQITQLFDRFRKLGALKSYKGSKGEATISITSGKKSITAHYVAIADFANGPASINVIIDLHNYSSWKILGFSVDAAALTQNSKQEKE